MHKQLSWSMTCKYVVTSFLCLISYPHVMRMASQNMYIIEYIYIAITPLIRPLSGDHVQSERRDQSLGVNRYEH